MSATASPASASAPGALAARLLPSPQVAQILRTLLAFFLALYAAYALELDSPSSAGLTVLIVASGSRGAVLSKSLWRIAGTLLGAIVSVLLIAWFAQAPWLFLVAFALWLGLCTFLASLLRYFRSYAAVLAGYTVALIAIPAVQDPGNVFHLATARLAVVSLGVLMTALVFLVTDTGPPPRAVLARVTGLAAGAAGLVRRALMGEGIDTLAAPRSGLAADLAAFDQTVEFVAVEDTGLSRHADAVRLAAAELYALLTGGPRTARLLNETRDDPRAAAIRARLLALLEGLAALRPGQPFEALHAEARDLQTLAAAEAGTCRDLPVLVALERADALLRQLGRILDTLAELRDDRPRAPALRLRVYANPVTAQRNGIRAALAILLGGGFWLVSGWSSGATVLTQLGPICALLATTESAAAASVGFFKGLALGTPVGLVLAYAVLPAITGFPLLVVVLAPFLVFGLLLAQRPKTMGMGTAFQIFLVATVAPGNPMVFNLEGALNSAFASLIGGACGVLAFRVLLPPDPVAEAGVLQRSLARAVRRLSRGALPPWLVWEHLQHQKLVRLSRRLAAIAPARRAAAVSAGSAAILVGRAVIRARLLAARPDLPPEAAAILRRCIGAFGRVTEAPGEVAGEALQGARALAALPEAPAAVLHAAAMLQEAGALLSQHPRFFRREAAWIDAPMSGEAT